MNQYSMKLSKNQVDLLIEKYAKYEIEKKIPHTIFEALIDELSLVIYNNGTLLLNGDYKEELKNIKDRLGLVPFSAIGSDEVGTGDLFGPIVVCSAYVPEDQIEILEEMGVKDSKNMTDRQIVELAPRLSKMLVHSVLILNPEKYNLMVRRGYNMNKIKAFLHNQAILLTQKKLKGKKTVVIVDQFCRPEIYYNYLKGEKNVYRDITFFTGAESVHISVAAASIIARYAFLAKMQQLSRFAGMKLLKGAGTDVDKQLIYLYKSQGYDILRPITKLNFKNLAKNNIIPPTKAL